eukprot:Trichotokara_eunicae@DN7417_c0_g1_i1.p1
MGKTPKRKPTPKSVKRAAQKKEIKIKRKLEKIEKRKLKNDEMDIEENSENEMKDFDAENDEDNGRKKSFLQMKMKKEWKMAQHEVTLLRERKMKYSKKKNQMKKREIARQIQ